MVQGRHTLSPTAEAEWENDLGTVRRQFGGLRTIASTTYETTDRYHRSIAESALLDTWMAYLSDGSTATCASLSDKQATLSCDEKKQGAQK